MIEKSKIKRKEAEMLTYESVLKLAQEKKNEKAINWLLTNEANLRLPSNTNLLEVMDRMLQEKNPVVANAMVSALKSKVGKGKQTSKGRQASWSPEVKALHDKLLKPLSVMKYELAQLKESMVKTGTYGRNIGQIKDNGDTFSVLVQCLSMKPKAKPKVSTPAN